MLKINTKTKTNIIIVLILVGLFVSTYAYKRQYVPARVDWQDYKFFRTSKVFNADEIQPKKVTRFEGFDVFDDTSISIPPNVFKFVLKDGKYVFYRAKDKETSLNIRDMKCSNIYIYPDSSQRDLDISLQPAGKVTRAVPTFKNGWKVSIGQNGKIDGKYNSIFYQSMFYYKFNFSEGWVVDENNFKVKMDEIFDKIGLNAKEKKDFMDFWSKQLEWDDKYYSVYYIPTAQLNEALKLNISTTPDSILRAFFYFKATDDKLTMKEPTINPFERKGLTVLEVGACVEE